MESHIAPGHHRDDALETLLLNLFYSGRLQAMPATYTTNDGEFRAEAWLGQAHRYPPRR